MPSNGFPAFGVCPDRECMRSFRKGLAIRSGLLQWRSAAVTRGAGDSAPHDPAVKLACRLVFQARPHPRGFCDACGKALLFGATTPELGDCPACHRPYGDVELERNSCSECGAPAEIDDSVRQQTAANAAIGELLNTLPHLKHYGYVDYSPSGNSAQHKFL